MSLTGPKTLDIRILKAGGGLTSVTPPSSPHLDTSSPSSSVDAEKYEDR
jgi:hypothetical protein